jgi:hypothetical protein
MSFLLLWAEFLTAALLWVAMLAACAGRKKASDSYVLRMFFICIVPLALLVGAAAGTGYLKFGLGIRINWFFYFCSLLAAFVVGLIVILFAASKPGELGASRAVGVWNRGRLSLAFLTTVAISGMTLWNMDVAARAQADAWRTEAGAMMVSVSPPVVSDQRNAAIVYQRAYDRLHADLSNLSTKKQDSPVNDATVDASGPGTGAFLDRQALTIKLLREAGAMPECRFDHDYAHPSISLLLPELNTSRSSVMLLRLDARRELARGHVAAAMSDINAMMQLSDHFGQEPILVCLLVATAFDKMAIDELELTLPMVTDKQQLAGLMIGDVAGPNRMLRRAFIGEEAFGLSVFSDIGSQRLGFEALTGDVNMPHSTVFNGPALADRGPAPMLFRIFFLNDELESYRQCLEQQRQPHGDGHFPTSANIHADDINEINGSRAGILSRLLVPALSKIRLNCARSEGYRANATIAVAMTRYRLDHGAYPDKLTALVPDYLDEIPADPFDGQSIRVLHGDDAWTIYSVGPDGKDDGGKPYSNLTATGDLTFVLRMPGAKPTTRPAQ